MINFMIIMASIVLVLILLGFWVDYMDSYQESRRLQREAYSERLKIAIQQLNNNRGGNKVRVRKEIVKKFLNHK